MSDEKLCIDCKWYNNLGGGHALCENESIPGVFEISLVDGHKMRMKGCIDLRSESGDCGPNGYFYEPTVAERPWDAERRRREEESERAWRERMRAEQSLWSILGFR